MLSKPLFKIVPNRRIFYCISLAFFVVGALIIALKGFNLDIDFAGGTEIIIDMGKAVDRSITTDVELLVERNDAVANASVQKLGDSGTQISIRIAPKDTENGLTSAQIDEVFSAVKEKYSLSDSAKLSSDNISSRIGANMISAAVWSTIAVVLLMLVYISIRFDLKSGIAAVIALMHDIFALTVVYSLFSVPLNLTFIAAALTILGFSINATIIEFDRVRENRKLVKKEDFAVTVEKSIWQTMARSVNTNLTTLFTIGAVLVLGVPAIKDFAFPLVIGILAGLYSSVFLAGSLWVTLRGSSQKA